MIPLSFQSNDPKQRGTLLGKVGCYSERFFIWYFKNRFFSLSYFSLILTESLRIRLFSTYIITMLFMAIWNKNQQFFLAFKMRSLRVSSYYVSYKDSSPNFFPYYLKFSFKTLLGHGTQHFHYKSMKAAQ